MDRGDPARGAEDLQDLPDIAELHHAAQPVWPDVGREHLDRGVPVLDRLGQRVEHTLRQFAVQQQMEPVIAVAGAGPLPFAQFDRLLQWLLRRARCEIEQGRRAAMESGAADLLGRRAQQILVAAGEWDRRTTVDVRIDAARHDDLPGGIDDPGCADILEASRSADCGDLAPTNADIGGFRAAARHHRCAAGNNQIKHAIFSSTDFAFYLSLPAPHGTPHRPPSSASATVSRRALQARAAFFSVRSALLRCTGCRRADRRPPWRRQEAAAAH